MNERNLRRTEVDELRGDASKALERLGWEPRTAFRDLVRLMLGPNLAEAGDPTSVVARLGSSEMKHHSASCYAAMGGTTFSFRRAATFARGGKQ